MSVLQVSDRYSGHSLKRVQVILDSGFWQSHQRIVVAPQSS